MPGSVRENDADVIAFVKENGIEKVLDVGAGKGTYSDLLRLHVDSIDAVEIWTPYIEQFDLRQKYDSVRVQDAREVHPSQFGGYDLVVFGDILEHMSREDSLRVWKNSSRARFGLISVPIIHYPQGAEFGNPYEEHVQEHLHPEDIRADYGPFVLDREYEVTGTFIKDFSAV